MNKIEELKKEYDRWFIRYQMFKYFKWAINELGDICDRESRAYSNYISERYSRCIRGFEKVEKKFLEVKASYEAALKEVA